MVDFFEHEYMARFMSINTDFIVQQAASDIKTKDKKDSDSDSDSDGPQPQEPGYFDTHEAVLTWDQIPQELNYTAMGAVTAVQDQGLCGRCASRAGLIFVG